VLDLLPAPRVDPLWAVAAELRSDPRPGVLDLVVGVYRDDTGRTPVLRAVQQAELGIAAAGNSKKYRGLSGNPTFNEAVTALALGSRHGRDGITTVQTVAGTGALRLLAELAATARPGGTAWISDPGYVNHEPVLRAAGLTVRTHPYLGPDGRVDGPAVLARLDEARAGDVVVVQASCHNPTGADPTAGWWSAFADLAAERGLVPLVDMAYQGFGAGLEEDAEGLRVLASRVGQVLVAVSCSKNFGLYSERTGCAVVVDADTRRGGVVRGHLETIARAAYSQPPDHGAAVVAGILTDPDLRRSWEEELATMRGRVGDIRARLVGAFRERGLGGAWTAVGEHRGLFSTLPLAPGQVRRLRAEHGVYTSDSGRINVAGLRREDVPRLADAVVEVGAAAAS
jgi:aspartate aminotransferase